MNNRCIEYKNQFYKCLAVSDRDVSRCEETQLELEQCSERFNENHCVREMVDLLNCSKNPGSDVCAKEFINMRECNRPEGPHIVIEDDYYKLTPIGEKKYNISGNIICPINPPNRSYDNIKNAIARLKSSLGLSNLTENFTPQIKS